MKSSSGKYYIALDHIRAIAIFTVFTWHFINVNYAHNGYVTPVPILPLSLLSEGHTGVAVFMTLSGYLFAKLLDGKQINYTSFIWNRFIRIAPLFFVVISFIVIRDYLRGADVLIYIQNFVLDFLFYWSSFYAGALTPAIPNGGWAIAVEWHFYLLLPFLLLLSKRSRYSLFLILLFAVLLRIFLHSKLDQIQTISYFTLVGRIDQFLLGIIAYRFRKHFTRTTIPVAFIAFIFAFSYWQFDLQGGFYHNPSYPSPSPIWIYMPTIEGVTYASLIAWYDNSFTHSKGPLSRFIASIGTYSYSIYLLHFFAYEQLAKAINNYIDLSNIYIALLLSPIAFLPMIPIGYLGYRLIELPFLKFRTSYIID